MAAVSEDVALERGLRESGLGEALATAAPIPTIDLTLPEEPLQQALWQAATEVGFFTVVGHGIPQELIDRAFSASSAFFSLDYPTKQAASPFAREMNSGYEYFAQVTPH